MPEHVAVEAHPPQHQERSDGPVGQRQRQTGHQRRAHEREGFERLHDQCMRRHHAAIAGKAISVGPQARQRRANTRVDGKRACTTSRSCNTAITVLPSWCHRVT